MSIGYYQQHADAFFAATKDIDVTSLTARYLSFIPPKGRILDAGCGSGRDSLFFKQQGFNVTAMDACPALVAIAAQHIGQEVILSHFETFQTNIRFDGIWACASLLHIPSAQLPNVFIHLADLLVMNGAFYCSFKYGDNEVVRDGRHFTNATEDILNQWIKDTSLELKESWITQDLRPERQAEQWLNAILIKR